MRVRLTESELVGLIRSIITEQDDTYSNFISQGFFNCRGIKLKIHNDGGGNGTGGGFVKDKTEWEDIKTITNDSKDAYNAFKKENPEISRNIDKEYFAALYRDADRMRTYNNNKKDFVQSAKESMFLPDGKTFNGSMKDVTAYSVDQILRSSEGFYFYWRNLFGTKNPTILDIYNHIESIGGKSAYEKLANSGYNAYQTRINMMNAIAKNELQNQKK